MNVWTDMYEKEAVLSCCGSHGMTRRLCIIIILSNCTFEDSQEYHSWLQQEWSVSRYKTLSPVSTIGLV